MTQGDLLSGAELQLAIAATPDLTWLAEAGGRVLAALVLRLTAPVAPQDPFTGRRHPHLDIITLPIGVSAYSARSQSYRINLGDAVLKLVFGQAHSN